MSRCQLCRGEEFPSRKRKTHGGQLWYDDGECGEDVDDEVSEIVMGVVGADEEEDDGDSEQELLGRRVLVAVVNLLPEIEIVVGAGVEIKGYAAHPVEHDVRAKHVRDVCRRPACLLRQRRNDVVQDLEQYDDDKVNDPRACRPKISGRSGTLFAYGRRRVGKETSGGHVPFALTHSAFRFGSALWSLRRSMLSAGSVYIRLLLRRRRPVLASPLPPAPPAIVPAGLRV